MGNDGESKRGGGIPSWQRVDADDRGVEAAKDQSTNKGDSSAKSGESKSEEGGPSTSQPSLLEQARLFLQDETIQNSPIDQKISFLESKGICKEDAENILQDLKDKPWPSSEHNSQNEARKVPTANSKASLTLPPVVPARDVPPIITYPEFLMQAQKPPPLITVQRLFNMVWAAAGVATAIHGTSKYLITPMSDRLTESRHEFAQHVQGHLDNLNSKLKEVVSTDPGDKPRSAAFHTAATPEAGDSASETGTVDSDPTELFHRDYGTQTSPVIAGIDEKSGYDSSSNDSEEASQAVIDSQAAKLKRLRNLCEGLNNDSANEGSTAEEIKTTLRVFKEYLEGLTYTATNQMYGYYGAGGGGAVPHDKKKDDEVNKMKAEIRSLKGVMLSAKNFPGARSGTFSTSS